MLGWDKQRITTMPTKFHNGRHVVGVFCFLLMPLCASARAADFFGICETGTPERVTAAIKAGADVNAKDPEGQTPLMVAAVRNNSPVIAALVKSGADVNAKDKNDMTPLMYAAWANPNPDVTVALTQADAAVDAKDRDGQTPLMYALNFNANSDVAAALIKAGANVNAKDNESQTPLMHAALHNKTKMIALLLKAGADVHATNARGQTVMEVARWANPSRPEVIAQLIQAGAIPATEPATLPAAAPPGWNKADNFFVICSTGTAAQVSAAIKAGAVVNAKGVFGQTPLMAAAGDNKNSDVIAALVKAGADVNAKNPIGDTPLMRAAQFNANPDVIAALLKAHADVHARRNDGWTPLMHAANHNSTPAVIATLIKAGADIHAKNEKGQTALDIAREAKNSQAEAELIKEGAAPATQPGAAADATKTMTAAQAIDQVAHTPEWPMVNGYLGASALRGQMYGVRHYHPQPDDQAVLLAAMNDSSRDLLSRMCVASFLLQLNNAEARKFLQSYLDSDNPGSITEAAFAILYAIKPDDPQDWAARQIIAAITSDHLFKAGDDAVFDFFADLKIKSAEPVLIAALQRHPGIRGLASAVAAFDDDAATAALAQTVEANGGFNRFQAEYLFKRKYPGVAAILGRHLNDVEVCMFVEAEVNDPAILPALRDYVRKNPVGESADLLRIAVIRIESPDQATLVARLGQMLDDSKDWAISDDIIDLLSKTNDPAAVAPVASILKKSQEPIVLQAGIDLLKNVNSLEATRALVDLLDRDFVVAKPGKDDPPFYLRQRVAAALEEKIGQKFGADKQKWLNYLSQPQPASHPSPR